MRYVAMMLTLTLIAGMLVSCGGSGKKSPAEARRILAGKWAPEGEEEDAVTLGADGIVVDSDGDVQGKWDIVDADVFLVKMEEDDDEDPEYTLMEIIDQDTLKLRPIRNRMHTIKAVMVATMT